MSEHLVLAMIKLFALLARIDGLAREERENIRVLLNKRFNKEAVPGYMALFDKVASQTGDPTNAIIRECEQIRNETSHQQKLVLLSLVIKLILADGRISQKEEESIGIIVKYLHISDDELKMVKMFLHPDGKKVFDTSDILVLSSQKEGLKESVRWMQIPDLNGCISFLNLPSIKPFFVRNESTNTLFLNNTPFEPGSSELFSTGSVLKGEGLPPIYYSDLFGRFKDEGKVNRIHLVAKDISYKFKTGNYGLQNITINESESRLIAIMGASGSGKSTLVNVLNGNMKPSSGTVTINGINIHTDKKEIEGTIGYVPQDDLLIDDLTVYENLYYAAKLCFGKLDEEKIHKLTEKTLSSLGLSETKNLKVGNALKKTISGGQRKRLNIGLELLREPSVMFMDEPTSGLSSRDSENIMDLLKELSLKGKLIFVVIHQPSSDIFKMFDSLLVLDVGGYPIYYGNPVEAVPYFRSARNMVDRNAGQCHECGNVNPEQIFNIIEARVLDEFGRQTNQRKNTPQTWYEYYLENKKSQEFTEEVLAKPRAQLQIPGWLKQTSIFIQRDVLSKISNKQYVAINLLEAPMLALLLSMLIRYYPASDSNGEEYTFFANVNIMAYIFMAIIVALFMGLTVSAEEIIKDRKILKREQFLHLSKGSYLVSKLAILFSLSAIQTLSFVLIGNLILDINGMTFSYWMVLFSASCFANALGLNISSAFNSVVTIYILIPILLIPQILLSGAVVKFDELNPTFSSRTEVPIVGNVMASKWALEAMMVTQYKDNKFERNFFALDKVISSCDYKKVYYIPKIKSLLDIALFEKLGAKGDAEKAKEKLAIVNYEIGKELEIVGRDKLPEANQLNIEAFDSLVYQKTNAFLDILYKFYTTRQNNAMEAKEQLIRSMTDTPEKKEAFEAAKRRYSNEVISDIVLNNKIKYRIVEENGRLVQKIYPIYKDPAPEHFFDSSGAFFQAQKHFAGQYIDTLYFNIGVIWLMTLVLVVLLYYDALCRLITKRKTP